jgi:hypothetical protein
MHAEEDRGVKGEGGRNHFHRMNHVLFSRCNELNKEHGVHLIRPHVQKVHSSPSVSKILPDQESIIHKKRQDHLKKMLSRRNGNLGSLSGGVKGFKFFVPEETDATSWQVSKCTHRDVSDHTVLQDNGWYRVVVSRNTNGATWTILPHNTIHCLTMCFI